MLGLLRALPAMGRHPATMPFVLRTLQQLLGAGEAASRGSPLFMVNSKPWHLYQGSFDCVSTQPDLRQLHLSCTDPHSQPCAF